jgi:hypothetical protein
LISTQNFVGSFARGSFTPIPAGIDFLQLTLLQWGLIWNSIPAGRRLKIAKLYQLSKIHYSDQNSETLLVSGFPNERILNWYNTGLRFH